MRRALIAGIHGNLIALEAVLKDIAVEGVDEIGCLGNIIGFGPDFIECVDLVREKCAWSLRGRYEERLFHVSDDLNSSLRKSCARERRLLGIGAESPAAAIARWTWLESLLPLRDIRTALFVHGSARDPQNEFLLPDDFMRFENRYTIKAEDAFQFIQPVCFCANTGCPGIVVQGSEWRPPTDLDDSREILDPNEKTIVNVGSVGQPRDRDPRSCYVVWDDMEHSVTFHRVPYDLAAAKKRFDRVPEIDVRYFRRLELGV